MQARDSHVTNHGRKQEQTRNDSTFSSSTSGIADDDYTENDNQSSPRGASSSQQNQYDSSCPAYDSFGESKRPRPKSYHIEKKCLKCCRLFIYILTFLVVVISGVVGKLNVLKIINDFNETSGEEKLTHAIYLLVLIGVYPTLSLLWSIFKIMFGKVRSLSAKLIIMLMVIEILHAVGILSFVFIVLPPLSTMSKMIAIGFLPIVPVFLSFIRSSRRTRKKCKKIVFHGVLFLIQLGLIALVYSPDTLGMSANSTNIWMGPLAVLFISLSWWENFIEINLPNSLRTSKSGTSKTVNDEISKGRNKVIAWTSLSRLLTVGLGVLLVYVDFIPKSLIGLNDHSPGYVSISPNITNGFNITDPGTETIQMAKSTFERLYDFLTIHYIVPLTITLAFLMNYCGTLACKLHMQRISFTIATLLISPLTFLYIYLQCSQGRLKVEVFIFETRGLCQSWTIHSPYQGIVFVVLCLSTSFLTYYTWFPNSERMAKLDSLFLFPLKDCILLDLNLLLRRKNDNNAKIQTTDSTQQRIIPQLYVCATMWHETRQEMFQLLKSLLRLDRHCALSHTAETLGKTTDPDKFSTEIHIIFDDAFDQQENQDVPNMFVRQFIECLDDAARVILGNDKVLQWNNKPVKCEMPYGGRLTWTLPGKTEMVIHMKNKKKIRRGKRWSQILYFYYLLGFKFFGNKEATKVLKTKTNNRTDDYGHSSSFINHLRELDDKTKFQNTFILTLDGDVDFKPSSVIRLIDRMKKNDQVGAVCGRIHPIGSGPVVWYQKFEYAIGHWLQKASEHVLGCVLCCPGCFSLFRASALVDDNVLKTYTKKPTEPLHFIQFELGEDRWLCTLLLQQGYKIDYCAGADARTFAPDSFNDFFIQRRRWAPSTLANIFDLLLSWRRTVNQNAEISSLFFAYQTLLMGISLLAPATVTMLIAGSYMVVLSLNEWESFILSIAPVIFYIFACLKLSEKFQLMSAAVLSTVYSVVMVVVTVGTIIQVSVSFEQFPQPSSVFLLVIVATFTLAALWHPREIGCLIHGVFYYITVPSTFVFLTIYYVCNLHIVKWGTRETKSAEKRETNNFKENISNIALMKNVFERAKKKLHGYTGESRDDFVPLTDIVEEEPQSQNEEIPDDPSSSFEEDRETPKVEEKFWNKVLSKYLKPVDMDTQSKQRIQEELINLRDKVVFGLFMLNFLFLVALFQLQMNRHQLTGYYILDKYEPVSMVFLGLFTLVLGVQVLSMLVHRWSTFQHLISSVSILTCSALNKNLSESEQFKLNFQTVKHSIEDNPDYDLSDSDVTDDDIEQNGNHGNYQRRDNKNKGFRESKRTNKSYRQTSDIYGTIARKNIARTLKRQGVGLPDHLRLPLHNHKLRKDKYKLSFIDMRYQGYDNRASNLYPR